MRTRAAIAIGASLGALVALAAGCGSRSELFLESAYQGDAAPLPEAGVDAPAGIRRLDCAEAGIQYIYVISDANELYSFNPAAPLGSEFTDIAPIQCADPTGSTPFSMAVDHRGVGYSVFSDGELYRIDMKTGACEPTPFAPGQLGFVTFGMGFVVDPGGASETLYVANDNQGSGTLGKIDTDTFVLSAVGRFHPGSVNMAELTSHGERLYAFYAPDNQVPPSFIVQVDPSTARVADAVELPGVAEGNGWAFGFWGGSFYTFTAPAGSTVVTRYSPSDGKVQVVAEAPPGVVIVGAGVSTCAPQ